MDSLIFWLSIFKKGSDQHGDRRENRYRKKEEKKS